MSEIKLFTVIRVIMMPAANTLICLLNGLGFIGGGLKQRLGVLDSPSPCLATSLNPKRVVFLRELYSAHALCVLCGCRLRPRGAQDEMGSVDNDRLRTRRHSTDISLPLEHGQLHGQVLPTLLSTSQYDADLPPLLLRLRFHD